jgi:hypothetical protein
MAKAASSKQQPAVPQPKKHPAARSGPPRGTRAEALDLIFETAERDGEGFRTGALGMPRVGKTHHLKEVVDQAHERGIVSVALIHDVKKREAQYEGLVRSSPEDLRARPPAEGDSPIIVFHPGPGADEVVAVEEVSAFGRQLGRGGTPTLVLVDELYAALKGRQTWDTEQGQKQSTTAWLFREGSSQGISIAWTTQVPQSLPTEALDLTETVALFHLEGRSASYAAEGFRLPPEAVALLSKLDRGEFLLFSAHRGWDGKIYGPK